MDSPPVRALHHESEHGQWDSFRRSPDPAFGDLVRTYEGYVEGASGYARRVEVATDTIPLIINFGAPIRVQRPCHDAEPVAFGHFMAGVHDAHVFVDSLGPSDVVQINLSPLGAGLFLGRPMSDLANQTVELTDLLGPAADEFAGRIYETPAWERRFELIDDFLRQRLAVAGAPPRPLQWAWSQLRAKDGAVNVGALAEQLGWTRKRLISEFRAHFGQPPKTLERILRFQAFCARLDTTESPHLGDLALECGYYDQAHLNRDFRAFSGLTPTEYLANRVPDGGLLG